MKIYSFIDVQRLSKPYLDHYIYKTMVESAHFVKSTLLKG